MKLCRYEVVWNVPVDAKPTKEDCVIRDSTYNNGKRIWLVDMTSRPDYVLATEGIEYNDYVKL